MTKFKNLQTRAKKLKLNLWKNGGYIYLLGFIRGKYRQGIFSNQHQVENQIKDEEKYGKA